MCQRPALTLMIALATCFQFKVCVGINDDDLVNFIFSRIPELQGQAADTGRHQFAALIFLDQTEVEHPEQFQFHPHHNDGTPWVDNTVSFSPTEPWNYIVARPESPYHAEEIILDQLSNMWNRYINEGTHGPPAMIVFFSRLYPCTANTPGETHECAEQIRDELQQAPYSTVPSRVLAYNADDESPVPDQQAQDIEYFMANIMIHGLPMGNCFKNNRMSRATNEIDMMTRDKADTCTEPSTIQSLQGCVLQCLGDDIYSCVEDSAVEGQKAYLMNILMDKCLLNQQREICFKDTFLEETGDACTLLQKQAVVDNLVQCHQKCSLKPISKPYQDARDFDNDIVLLTSAKERQNYQEPTSFGCKDTKSTGLLCTYVKDDYLTAGNSF